MVFRPGPVPLTGALQLDPTQSTQSFLREQENRLNLPTGTLTNAVRRGGVPNTRTRMDHGFTLRTSNGRIVGYVLAKLDEDSTTVHGHITSLAVLRTHRKLGIAAKLMRAAHDAMQGTFDAEYCSLHVRVSNAAAIHLYVDVLGYAQNDVEAKYYADGEDAHDMRKTFKRLAGELDGQAGSDKALVDSLKAMAV